MPFSLQNAESTFQWGMTLIFHDLKTIIEVYWDDLAAQSCLRVCHPYHLRLLFEICRHYQVRLKPHKYIVYVTFGRLLRFIILKEGIRVNLLKVEAILQLYPPRNIRHLQCLQGMENFLQRFVVNFSNLTKGFMHLLKKDTPFYWDGRSQESFDALKISLATSPMLSPPDYSRDILIYVAASQEMISMVLVQEDEELHEHVIYYLSQNLIDAKLCYSHVEKLALATIHVV